MSKVDWQLINPDIIPLAGWEVLSEEYDGKHSFLVEYYKACRRGDIIIGRELKTELENFIDVMKTSKNPNQRAILPEKVKRKEKTK